MVTITDLGILNSISSCNKQLIKGRCYFGYLFLCLIVGHLICLALPKVHFRKMHIAMCKMQVARCILQNSSCKIQVARYILQNSSARCILKNLSCKMQGPRYKMKVARYTLKCASYDFRFARCNWQDLSCKIQVAR